MLSPIELFKRQLTLTTDRIHALPIVVLMPHSRCNCRCVMCDIWKGNRDRQELTRADLAPHVETLRRWRTSWVVLSGGEALMHSNLWTLCELLKHELGAKITLLSTGLLLRRWAGEVTRWCDEVIVSLDGPRRVHDEIRDVPRAYERLADGVLALREHQADYPVTARCVVQRRNYRDLTGVVDAARDLGLDHVSFLAADVSTEAFNRPDGWDGERVADVALSSAEAVELTEAVERMIAERSRDFSSGFIVESPDKLRRLAAYFRALNSDGEFPPVSCNAPWVSAVVEADGTVRPCFFHRALGNVREQSLEAILNAPDAVAFRRDLDMARDPICRKCVCTLRLGRFDDV
ncbi:MAG: radical SAM protein [Thermoanaerobaculia bacterium]